MKIKPDQYFNNVIFEMAQIGNSVYLKNILPKDQHATAMKSTLSPLSNRLGSQMRKQSSPE